MGLLLRVVVQPAGTRVRVLQDRDGACTLLRHVRATFPRLVKIWVDRGYEGDLVAWAREQLGVELEIVRRDDGQRGFVVLPRRWVVERTFAWFGWNRRLSRDYEYFTEYSESWVYLASIQLMLRRLAISQENETKAA